MGRIRPRNLILTNSKLHMSLLPHRFLFRTAHEKRKEMKLLLDMYKGVSKETREKAEVRCQLKQTLE